jgi:hypothetical protein
MNPFSHPTASHFTSSESRQFLMLLTLPDSLLELIILTLPVESAFSPQTVSRTLSKFVETRQHTRRWFKTLWTYEVLSRCPNQADHTASSKITSMARTHLSLWLPEYLRRLLFFTGEFERLPLPASVKFADSSKVVVGRRYLGEPVGNNFFSLAFHGPDDGRQAYFYPTREDKQKVYRWSSAKSRWQASTQPSKLGELADMAFEMVRDCLLVGGSVSMHINMSMIRQGPGQRSCMMTCECVDCEVSARPKVGHEPFVAPLCTTFALVPSC